MKVEFHRVGTGRLRARPRLGTRKPPRKPPKRLWAPYKHRELVLHLIGLALILGCIAPIPLHYWYRFQAERHFASEASRGRPLLAQVEQTEDLGRAVLPPDSAYDYGDPFPTSGPHDRNWIEPGFYASPRAATFLVSSLERGLIVVYYDKPEPLVLETLKDWAALFHGDRDGIVVVAHPDLGHEIVLTAWAKRLRLASFDPGAAAAFVDTYRGYSAAGTPR